jgi:stress-induced-phosphoprotein 1
VRKAAGYGGNGEKAETEEERRARAERSMQDPEIRNILQDPAMQRVLQDMGTDANAARAHMSDPVIAAKIQKLMAAGVVQMG